MFGGTFFLTVVTDYSLGMLVRALDSDFAVLSENIGLWIPVEIISQEHDDKPEGEEDTGN